MLGNSQNCGVCLWASPVMTSLAVSFHLLTHVYFSFWLHPFPRLWTPPDLHIYSCQAQVPVCLGCHTFSEPINVVALLPALGWTPLPTEAHVPQSFHSHYSLIGIVGCWTRRWVCGYRLSWPLGSPLWEMHRMSSFALDILSSPPSSFRLFSQYHNISVF